MASQSFALNDAATVKLWSKRMDAEALYKTQASEYIGEGKGSLAQVQTETKKGAGDFVKFGIRMQATGDGTTEGETQEGNEESITRHMDGLVINELGHAFRTEKGDTSISEQRVPYNFREEMYETASDWYATRKDVIFFNQLAGNTAETRAKYFGFNAPSAPTATRIIRAKALTTDQAIAGDSTATFKLSDIDKMVNVAETTSPMFRPLKGMGPDVDWVCFIHPDQELSLRGDTATAGNWFDLQGKKLQGGEGGKNGLYTGALGIYNRTMLVKTKYLPRGIHSSTGAVQTNTRRAVFCGAQAMAVAYGQNSGPTKYTWVEELFDYKRSFGVRVSSIFGMKKTVYNSVDNASIVYTTYAAPAV
jgi:N4-gp56 family major capsid protein